MGKIKCCVFACPNSNMSLESPDSHPNGLLVKSGAPVGLTFPCTAPAGPTSATQAACEGQHVSGEFHEHLPSVVNPS